MTRRKLEPKMYFFHFRQVEKIFEKFQACSCINPSDRSIISHFLSISPEEGIARIRDIKCDNRKKLLTIGRCLIELKYYNRALSIADELLSSVDCDVDATLLKVRCLEAMGQLVVAHNELKHLDQGLRKVWETRKVLEGKLAAVSGQRVRFQGGPVSFFPQSHIRFGYSIAQVRPEIATVCFFTG